MRIVCIKLPKHSDAQSIAEIFYRATPQIRLRHNEAIFLEVSKCQHLYSESTFIKRAQITLKRIGITAELSVADDISTALSLATFPVMNKDALPVDALIYYADPLAQYPEQHGRILKAIHLLKSLGIRTIADFLTIPSYDISPRFGPIVLLAYQRLLGQHEIPWNEFRPREVVEESHEFDLAYPPRDLEPVYFTLRPLLDRIYLRLRGRGQRVRQFNIILQQEYATRKSPQTYKVPIIIQLPFVSVKTIFQIAKEKLDAVVQRKPLEHPIIKISLVVTEEAPYLTSQRDLFDQKKEETSESFFHLVSRLATKLGSDGAFFAHVKENYLPERTWFRVPEKSITTIQESHIPERPLRLLKEPRPVPIQDNYLFHNRMQYEIKEWKNPEVLLSNWWEISGGERVYYKLVTHTGDNFWVFKNKEQYYLHGIFE
ncbi:MAG: hypothetical protein JNM24_02670 [Bdellovibrionaceae bacterium]|nr:hypothetical protein [Pseudobdellovibrionaceae bacterium]